MINEPLQLRLFEKELEKHVFETYIGVGNGILTQDPEDTASRILTFELSPFPYKIKEKVWFMHNNRVASGYVHSMTLREKGYRTALILTTDSQLSNIIKGEQFFVDSVFKTKDALLEFLATST